MLATRRSVTQTEVQGKQHRLSLGFAPPCGVCLYIYTCGLLCYYLLSLQTSWADLRRGQWMDLAGCVIIIMWITSTLVWKRALAGVGSYSKWICVYLHVAQWCVKWHEDVFVCCHLRRDTALALIIFQTKPGIAAAEKFCLQISHRWSF